MKNKYPEHKKMNLFSPEQMDALCEFCEYMDGAIEAKFVDEAKPRIGDSFDILYDFLEVDKWELEKERLEMLHRKVS